MYIYLVKQYNSEFGKDKMYVACQDSPSSLVRMYIYMYMNFFSLYINGRVIFIFKIVVNYMPAKELERSTFFFFLQVVSTEARAMYNVGLVGLTYWAPNVKLGNTITYR